MMGSSRSSALYSVSAWGGEIEGSNIITTENVEQSTNHNVKKKVIKLYTHSPFRSLPATGSCWLVPHISASLSVGEKERDG